MSHLLTPPRQVPRWRSAPPPVVGAPDTFVDGMTIAAAAARSELPSGEPTPGRKDWLAQKKREEDELFAKYSDGEDEESSTSEEDSDSDDKDEDPDVGKNGAPQKCGAPQKRGGPRKRAAAGVDGPRKRRTPEGGSRGQYPCEMEPDARAEYYKAKAEKKAAKKAEGADELKAAAAALKKHDLYKKPNYKAILAEVENWAERGGTVLTAAKWIRCLVSEGDDRLAPSRVRLNYKQAYPYAA